MFRFSVTRILLTVLVLCSLALTKADPPVPSLPDDPKILAQFSIAKDGDLIVLPVTFRDKTYGFFVDTGSTVLIYDLTLKPYLGDPVKTQKVVTPTGVVEMEMFASPEAFLGSLPLETEESIVCQELTSVRYVTGRDIYGIIDMSFLRNFILQIDFDNGRLTLLKASAVPTESWGIALTLQISRQRLPLVFATLFDTLPEHFPIDTGTTGSGYLQSGRFEYLINQGLVREIMAVLVETATGTMRVSKGKIASFTVGPFRPESLFFGSGIVSNIGLSYLSRCHVTIDFPHQILYLKKGQDYTKEDLQGMSGLALTRNGGQTIVHSVDPNSPAREAGIIAEDVIVTMNDKPIGEFDLSSLREVLSGPEGKTINLMIQRNNTQHSFSFNLRSMVKH